MHRRFPVAARLAASAALGMLVAGCSLVTLKSPEKPLSTRDLNARIVTREYSIRFIAGVEQTADRIAAHSDDAAIRINALRWKIAAAAGSERAASQMAPMMGLLDSWALSIQMHEYFADGPGRAAFGDQQTLAVALSEQLAGEARSMVQRLTSAEEFEVDRRFVDGYVHADPIESLNFARGSIVDLWTRETGSKVKIAESLGTVPEAMANVGDLLRLYGEAGPSQVLWKAQLAVQETGINRKDFQTALDRLDARMARLSAMADATPGLVNGVVRETQTRVAATFAEMMNAVHGERASLAASVASEREAAVRAMDAERAAVAVDAARLAEQVVRQTGEEVRRLVREALLSAIALALVLLGLPFAAGYLVGRARSPRPPPAA